MLRLEFDNGVNPDEIKTALAGSSLASASILLLKLLCVISLFALSSIIVGVVYFRYLLHLLNIEPSPLAFIGTLLVLDFPFFLVACLSPRMRYFQPSNCDSSFWLFRLVLKGSVEQFSVSAHSQNYESLPSQVPQQDAVKVADDLASYIPQAFAITLNTLLRKHGFRLAIRWKNIDAMMWGELRRAVEIKAGELLYRKFPDVEPELHATLKEYFVNLLWKL